MVSRSIFRNSSMETGGIGTSVFRIYRPSSWRRAFIRHTKVYRSAHAYCVSTFKHNLRDTCDCNFIWFGHRVAIFASQTIYRTSNNYLIVVVGICRSTRRGRLMYVYDGIILVGVIIIIIDYSIAIKIIDDVCLGTICHELSIVIKFSTIERNGICPCYFRVGIVQVRIHASYPHVIWGFIG